jgi:SLT domain-containing protein
MPDIPMLANGGIVTSPTLALIGEAGPEAVIPLSQMGNMGGGMNITVNAGLVSTPDQIGQLIIDSILRQQRRSGTVFAAA